MWHLPCTAQYATPVCGFVWHVAAPNRRRRYVARCGICRAPSNTRHRSVVSTGMWHFQHGTPLCRFALRGMCASFQYRSLGWFVFARFPVARFRTCCLLCHKYPQHLPEEVVDLLNRVLLYPTSLQLCCLLCHNYPTYQYPGCSSVALCAIMTPPASTLTAALLSRLPYLSHLPIPGLQLCCPSA